MKIPAFEDFRRYIEPEEPDVSEPQGSPKRPTEKGESLLTKGKTFPSADAAAMDFAKKYGPKSDSEYTEYGAFIYMNGDKTFSYTAPKTAKETGNGTAAGSDPAGFTPIPQGTKMIGMIHSHPWGDDHKDARGIGVSDFDPTDHMSDGDIRVAYNGRPSRSKRDANGQPTIETYGGVHYNVNGNTGGLDKFICLPFFRYPTQDRNWPRYDDIPKLPGFIRGTKANGMIWKNPPTHARNKG